MGNITLAQLKIAGGGMSYVIHCADGKFVLIDGGYYCEEDEARLYDYLRSRAEGGRPVIAAWLFTHGHYDHVGLAARFMVDRKDSVTIERFLYNIPVEGFDFSGYDAGGKDAEYEAAWFRAVKLYPEADCHEVQTGEVYDASGIRIEVLTCAYDKYPDPPTNRNQSSAVYQLTFPNGVRFMVLGDACGNRLLQLNDPASPIYRTDEQLKSDILQVAHHGLAVCGAPQYEGVRELYRRIAPSVCFWPTPAKRFYNDPWCQAEKHIYNRFLLESVRERNFHHTQTVEIDVEDMSVSVM